MLDSYDRLAGVHRCKTPKLTCSGHPGILRGQPGALSFAGTSLFPADRPRAIRHQRQSARAGSNLEATEEFVAKVEDIAREEVLPEDLDLVLSNIGITPDISAIYTSNSGMNTAFVQVNLKEGHKVGSYEYMDRVRRRLKKEVPEVTA